MKERWVIDGVACLMNWMPGFIIWYLCGNEMASSDGKNKKRGKGGTAYKKRLCWGSQIVFILHLFLL
jgi:hypothetical protein